MAYEVNTKATLKQYSTPSVNVAYSLKSSGENRVTLIATVDNGPSYHLLSLTDGELSLHGCIQPYIQPFVVDGQGKLKVH